jgi:hypothetical protein
MSRNRRALERILSGTADAGIRFRELRAVLMALNFDERVRGSHHIFTRADVAEIINLQPSGNLAKPYQVKQIRQLLLRYRLGDAL